MAFVNIILLILGLGAATCSLAATPAELIALPEPALTEKFRGLAEPWREQDTAARTEIVSLTGYVLRPDATPAEKARLERALIAALLPPGNAVNRAFLVQQLESLRCADAVPALTGLLGDADLFDPAARALGAIGGPQAQAALVAALPRANPQQTVALLTALAEIPDGMAGVALPFVSHAGRDVRLAALLILSRTDDPQAIEPLQRAALAEPSYERDTALALLADYAARLPRKQAERVANALLRTDTGVCAGLSLLREPRTLIEHLNDPRADVRRHAFLLLTELPPERWQSAVSKLVAGGPDDLRVPAIRSMATLPRRQAERPLRQALAGEDAAARREAAVGLLQVVGSAALPDVLELLKREPAGSRASLAEAILKQTRTAPLALEFARDDDAGVRRTAWQQLAVLAGPGDLPAMFDLALSQDDATAGNAAVRAAVRLKAQTAAAAHLASATQSNRQELVMGWLGALGGERALDTVVARLDSPARVIAVRTLGNWKTADALPHLLALATASKDTTEQVLAIRGAVRLVDQSELGKPEKTGHLNQLLNAASRAEEKDLVQAALRRLEAQPEPPAGKAP